MVEICESQHVTIPETSIALDEGHLIELRETIDPLRPSDHNGVDIYLEVLQFLHARLSI